MTSFAEHPAPATVVDHYLQAIERHDYDRARALLDERSFRYVSPISRFDDVERFIEHMSLTGGILQRIEIRKQFVDGPDVCHFMVFHVQISEKMKVDVVQWVQVREGRIARIEALFDAHPYRILFESEAN
ncbi:nuclear transport factor 2 family protein [Ectothiorhodospira shaposhnikovii]|uniref:nuclear transport factor 2 family protein n=1 Tax=Ectothiorhodospira shaposhnikovii TaxID=1054 RepID=UPI001EE88451|nr:nuclear transport factor 2 family protein [Ectothiorhodospira shaposhnikovii]MCG5511684.1 nuclear transport factor 2 family protein [Ectothiorhodospira shaposhnikovii]